jgi:prepilin-type N-terminal cleavage/methylation domain-containing protein
MCNQTDLRSARTRGFSLVESLVTLAIVTILMVGLFTMLEHAGTISKQETNVADAQASGRSALYEVSKIVREARIGQLYYGNAILPYLDNALAGNTLTDATGTPHRIREGTDSIEVRGAFYNNPYSFTVTNITCNNVACDSTNANVMRIQIDQTCNLVPNITQISNYPAGGLPVLASRTKPFYFAVATTALQPVTVGGNTYKVPLYYVGRVDAVGNWYTNIVGDPLASPPILPSFSFYMDGLDVNAQKMLASSTLSTMKNPYSGAVIDDVIFFVDDGIPDAGTTNYSHPYLAQAILDPSTGTYDIQPIAGDVEDFQIAYGIDSRGIAVGSPRDRGVSPSVIDVTSAGADEWVMNASGEALTDMNPQTGPPVTYDAFIDSSIPSTNNDPKLATPALKAVLLAVVVKSVDPDIGYSGAGYDGIQLFNSVKSTTSVSLKVTPQRPYRRRVQQMAVSLRNYL